MPTLTVLLHASSGMLSEEMVAFVLTKNEASLCRDLLSSTSFLCSNFQLSFSCALLPLTLFVRVFLIAPSKLIPFDKTVDNTHR